MSKPRFCYFAPDISRRSSSVQVGFETLRVWRAFDQRAERVAGGAARKTTTGVFEMWSGCCR
jgi:hypothetical protein